MFADLLTDDSVFRVGTVTSVDGRVVSVKVDKTKNTSHLIYKGEVLRNIAVGSYIKIAKGFTSIIGKVDGEFISEDKYFKAGYGNEQERISRTLKVKLLGFLDGTTFHRGIKELPLLDNECFLLQHEEFNRIHDFVKADDPPLTIGTLALEKGQPIRVGINSLFGSHIGIFGNTGSGKSYTLAKMYRELFERYKENPPFLANSEFFIIDFNGEYVDDDANDIIVEDQYKDTYRLSTRNDDGDKYPVTSEVLHSPEFWAIFLEATEKTQRPFLRRAISSTYLGNFIDSEDHLKQLLTTMIHTVTTRDDRLLEKGIVSTFLSEFSDCLGGNASVEALANDYRSNLHFHSQGGTYYYQNGNDRVFSSADNFRTDFIENKVALLQLAFIEFTDIDFIRLRIVLQYYDEIFKGFSNKDHLAPVVKRLDKRTEDLKRVIRVTQPADSSSGRNITIVSLRDVNIHLRKILPLLFCKNKYDAQKARTGDDSYLNIIVDEAHNILSQDSFRESEQWTDYRLETFEEIIKEGRKFGVFLTLASQRPSDISPTIISQLHNYFIHRLVNEQDIRAVERTIAYLDKVSFEYLPILPTGTCVLAGLVANIPVVVAVGEIPKRFEPQNKTRNLTNHWQ